MTGARESEVYRSPRHGVGAVAYSVDLLQSSLGEMESP